MTNNLHLLTLVLCSFKSKRNGRHFVDDIFKYNFMVENYCILIQISLNCVHKGHHCFRLWLATKWRPRSYTISLGHNEVSTTLSIQNQGNLTYQNNQNAVFFLSIICIGHKLCQSTDSSCQLNFWPRLHISDGLVHDGSLDDGSVKDGSDHYICNRSETWAKSRPCINYSKSDWCVSWPGIHFPTK